MASSRLVICLRSECRNQCMLFIPKLKIFCSLTVSYDFSWLEESTKLPFFWLYFSAIMFHLIFVIVLLYVGATSWRRAQRDTFISLKSDSGICTEVSRSVSALYSATVDGYWSSQPGFRYNQTSYFMQMEDFTPPAPPRTPPGGTCGISCPACWPCMALETRSAVALA